MNYKIFTFILICTFAALLTATQNSFLLAGGSDSGEVIISPEKWSQWLSLALFSIVALLPANIIHQAKHIARPLKSVLLTISIPLIISGHTYRHSSRAHALIDTWYFIPLQTLAPDPNKFIVNAKYQTTTFFTSIYADDQSQQIVLSIPGPFGIRSQDFIQLLQGFGFQKKSDI